LVEVVAVSVRMSLEATASTLCHFHDGPVLVLHTFRRKGYSWLPVEHQIEFQDVALAAQWMNIIQNLLDRLPDRPDHLFVVINPYGGAGRADNVWLDVVKPIFERAHIASDAFRTGYQDHAVSLIEQMPWEQLEAYDGIVAIGGDGLFQECLRGLLALRTRGGKWRDKARSIRIAQVPAGSTDAVACTINGCRSSVTAAMHIVVGDRSKLDVLEVRWTKTYTLFWLFPEQNDTDSVVVGRCALLDIHSRSWMGRVSGFCATSGFPCEEGGTQSV
jgi:hypothetical protein